MGNGKSTEHRGSGGPEAEYAPSKAVCEGLTKKKKKSTRLARTLSRRTGKRQKSKLKHALSDLPNAQNNSEFTSHTPSIDESGAWHTPTTGVSQSADTRPTRPDSASRRPAHGAHDASGSLAPPAAPFPGLTARKKGSKLKGKAAKRGASSKRQSNKKGTGTRTPGSSKHSVSRTRKCAEAPIPRGSVTLDTTADPHDGSFAAAGLRTPHPTFPYPDPPQHPPPPHPRPLRQVTQPFGRGQQQPTGLQRAFTAQPSSSDTAHNFAFPHPYAHAGLHHSQSNIPDLSAAFSSQAGHTNLYAAQHGDPHHASNSLGRQNLSYGSTQQLQQQQHQVYPSYQGSKYLKDTHIGDVPSTPAYRPSNPAAHEQPSCFGSTSTGVPVPPQHAHRLSSGPVPPGAYPYPQSSAAIPPRPPTSFQQDHALTPSGRASTVCRWICSGDQSQAGGQRQGDGGANTAAAIESSYQREAGSTSGVSLGACTHLTAYDHQGQPMGNLMNSTTCSLRSRGVSSRAPEPTEEDYFRDWHIGPSIGSGGYSEVFRVTHRHDPSVQKAAKRVEFLREADFEEFMHEAAIIKELGNHRHVLPIQGLIKGARHGWMIFELMHGDAYDMFTKNERNRALTVAKERQVAEAVRQLLIGLIYCHKVGIVHFDIKPQNILYRREPGGASLGAHAAPGQTGITWKLCDFNLARHLRNHSDGFYSQVYTLGYRAPEVIIAEHTKGRTRYAEKAERYGIGATTFQMLTEFCAFESFLSPQTEDTDKDFIRCVLTKNLIECLDSHELLTLEARDFILRMMMFSPDDRMSLEEALEHPFVTRAHEKPPPKSLRSAQHYPATSASENQNFQNTHGTVAAAAAVVAETAPSSAQHALPSHTSAPPAVPLSRSQHPHVQGASSHTQKSPAEHGAASATATSGTASALSPPRPQKIDTKAVYHKSKLRYLKEYHTRKLKLS